jgi:microcin C transport system ATP-binding protein
MSLLFITHDLGIVRRIADRVCVMKDGEIVEQGPTAEIFADPKHPYTRSCWRPSPRARPSPVPEGRRRSSTDGAAGLVPDPARACCAARWAM